MIDAGIESALLTEIDTTVANLVIATLLGLFLGLEREWSQKTAGIRTFALISLLGAVFVVVDYDGLLIIGGILIIAHAVLLAIRSFIQEEHEGLSLTTSVSMLVAYSIGVLVAEGLYLEGVTVAVMSSLLLVLKRELHEFAWGLSKEEVRSATEFVVLAFVIYPLLPNETMGPWNAIQPRVIWILVIAISAIGFVNYILVKQYEGRGIAFTGFFGGLVNSTAVIAEMAKRATRDPSLTGLAVGAILLANAAMAIRNAVVVAAFIPSEVLTVGLPLGAIAVTGVLLSMYTSDWTADLETDLQSPFSLRNALTFGGLFLIVLLVSAGAQEIIGASGFVMATFLAGLVSSGTAATTAVTLVSTGQITPETGVLGVIAGTAASISVKVFFAATIERSLIKPVVIYNAILIAVGIGFGVVSIFVL
ncbi:MgtC/SapB family protein [Natrarchaeobius chitinivorans]|uniref:MgtC/SapB family protein n=1 Tax=Natrarchaeobius chitinivorans TaxID=1679083 RepID=UPI001FB311E3|nr:MgtC/SapB family protein [Natrarchaeobius chitinivorans]